MARWRGLRTRPRMARVIHQDETHANWITVRVTGCGKALRMVLDEVLVRAELIYQTRQSTWKTPSACIKACDGCRHTISLTEMGAFRASANSAAFAVTLPFLVLMVWMASPMLFCRPCFDGIPEVCVPEIWPLPHETWLSLLACHLSFRGPPLLPDHALGLRIRSVVSLWGVGKKSPDEVGSRSGNLVVS